jgi:hypothetical protein
MYFHKIIIKYSWQLKNSILLALNKVSSIRKNLQNQEKREKVCNFAVSILKKY